MIVCVSLNPALDRCIWLPALVLGQVNRASSVQASPGGKSANVALAARALGGHVRYVGLLGGAIGQAVAEGLAAHGVEVEAVSARQPTRVNLELIHAGGVTEVLEPGHAPTPDELAAFLGRCKSVFAGCGAGSVVAFSGSLPQGVDPGVYAELVELGRGAGLRVILDTSGAWLERGLAAKPHFVKPNRDETEALLGRKIGNASDARLAVKELVERGAQAAIVSLGSAGLVGSDGDRAYLITPPKLDAPSAVASGDATVAGLALALERGDARAEALAFAAACGAANCLADSPALIDRAVVADLRARTTLSEL